MRSEQHKAGEAIMIIKIKIKKKIIIIIILETNVKNLLPFFE